MLIGKKLFPALYIIIQGISLPAFTQPPVYWQKSIGGSNNDNRALIEATTDGGYVVVSNCRSSNGNVNIPSRGGADVLVIKMDSCGTVQWQKTYGGSREDLAYSLDLTADGGYIFAGMTNSNDGDVNGLHGNSFDWWIVKLDAAGTIQWKRTIGGSNTEVGSYIAVHPNGNMVIVGHTLSGDGDLAGVPPASTSTLYEDAWIAYLGNTGNIIWQKKLGSAGQDVPGRAIIAPDGTIVVCGAMPADWFLPAPVQPPNAWVFKMDINGNILWNKTFGGTQSDHAISITANTAGELIVAGDASSSDGDLTINYGDQDAWVFKLTPDGGLLWQLSLGGNNYDRSWDITLLPDQTILLCGETRSTNPSFLSQYGQGDAFFADINNSGQLLWKQNYGGSLPDLLFAVKPSSGGVFIASGISGSSDHDLTNNYGSADIWIAKFKNKPLADIDTTVCISAMINNTLITNDTLLIVPLKDICGHDSAYKKYTVDVLKPVVRSIDDTVITSGQSITLFTTATGTIAWNADPTLSCLNCNDPVATPIVTTRYFVTAQEGICTARDTVKIQVAGKDELYVPSAFSPNGDGINDDFRAIGFAQDFYMQVFNRWGERIFSSRDINKGWNGQYKGKLQPAGNYVCQITYADATGKRKLLKGNVMLLK